MKGGVKIKMFKKNRGFTLIELLVVIAIIGILSTIVLVSLSTARNKANDAAIQADMNQVRSIAEMVYGDNNNYSSLCTGSGGLCTDNSGNCSGNSYTSQLSTIVTDVSGKNGGTAPICYTSGSAYCSSATLNTGGNSYCIDSTGYAGLTSSTSSCVSSNDPTCQ